VSTVPSSDGQLRQTIYRHVPADKLLAAVEECDQLVRPLDDSYFDFLARRYSHIREFAHLRRRRKTGQHGSGSGRPSSKCSCVASTMSCRIIPVYVLKTIHSLSDRSRRRTSSPRWQPWEALVDARLPLIELPDLLMEVDGWTGFSRHLEHAGGAEPRTPDLLVHCHASILAQACNFGLTRMAQLADLSYRQLARCTTWYLREETLQSAIASIVTTDTAGYTDLVFGFFDLLGLQFSSRLRDLADQTLYRIDKSIRYQHFGPLVRGAIKPRLFLAHWDDLLRAAGSLKLGWVTASLFIAKLQSSRRKNVLTRALQEYGRLNKTIFILRYLLTEQVQRRIGTQINKGEALHALRGFLFLANEAKIRRRHYEEQLNQASCLNLVTNAVVLWNTVYMSAVLDQLKAQGYPVDDADVAHLWPARYANINPYGKYRFNVEGEFHRKGLRPLRQPDSGLA
jgi:hypothetical protein